MKGISPFRVVFIGDSHVLKFSSRLFDLGNCFFFTESTYVHGGKSTEVVDTENRVVSPILSRFSSEKIINGQGKPWFDASYFDLYSTIKHAEGRAARPDPIIFFFGDIELRKLLGGKITTTAEEVVEKYTRDIAGLKKITGVNLLIHALDPPTKNTDLFEKINGFRVNPTELSRAYAAFNGMLSDRCAHYGLTFISTWHETFEHETGRGCRDTYEFDGVHLHPTKGAEATMRVVSRFILYSRTADAAAPAYFTMAKRVASRPPLTIKRLTQVPVELCAQLSDPVGLAKVHDPAPSPLWGGAPPDSDFPKFNPSISYGALSLNALTVLHKILYGSHYAEIRDAIGDFILANSRYVDSQPNSDEGIGPQKFHYDGNPVGIVRGLIYLCDVDPDGGPFEWKVNSDSQTSSLEVGPTGSFLLFDANQLSHRAHPPRARSRQVIDLIFIRAKHGAKKISLSMLGKTWPVDPRLIAVSATDTAVESTVDGIRNIGEGAVYLD